MNLHLHKLDILKLVCDKFNIVYNEIKDENTVIDIELKDKGVCITWEGKGFEVTGK